VRSVIAPWLTQAMMSCPVTQSDRVAPVFPVQRNLINWNALLRRHGAAIVGVITGVDQCERVVSSIGIAICIAPRRPPA